MTGSPESKWTTTSTCCQPCRPVSKVDRTWSGVDQAAWSEKVYQADESDCPPESEDQDFS